MDVGSRWQDICNHLAPRLHEHFLPFQDLHFIYALARNEQFNQVAEMLDSMVLYAQSGNSLKHQLWTEIAIPVAEGIIAYAKADWSQAIAYLKPVLPRLQEIGGSHTQRALFQQLYADAVQKDQRQRAIVPCATPQIKRCRSALSVAHPFSLKLARKTTSVSTGLQRTEKVASFQKNL